MIKYLFDLQEGQRILDMQLVSRGSLTLFLLFVIGSIAYTILHYRSVREIPSKGRSLTGLCHLLALLVIVFCIAMPAARVRYSKEYRPTMLVLVDTSRSMAVNDKRVTAEALSEAARIIDGLPFDEKVSEDVIQQYLKDANRHSRLDLVKALFKHPDINLLERAGKRFDVRFFSYDQGIAPEGGATDPAGWLANCEAKGDASQIGNALREAVSRYAGLKVAGVMVFSDFGWAGGEDPTHVADDLESRGIPVYPIPIGIAAPPDAMISEIIAPEAVFRGDPVNLRIRLQSRGLEDRGGSLKLTVDGVEVETQSLTFVEGSQFVEMRILPRKESGSLELRFHLDGTAADTNLKNNKREHRIRIIEEKINVLYLEGKPRWEFRYLRWVLLRNPHLRTRFLMTEGDPELAALSPLYMAGFPEDTRNIFEYDLIIIGDVASKYFKPGQLQLLEEQIRIHGGSLIMLAGMGAAPSSYRNTPLETILPVRIGAGKPYVAANNEFPHLPDDQAHAAMVVLHDTPEINGKIWSKIRPMGRLPALDGAKPLANVLLHLPGRPAEGSGYPVVSWHNYGKGKCMFVATDRLWRLRREVGDVHHGRFWGQAIQFLAISRLLGQNKRISLQTDRNRYNSGEAVRIYANVLSEDYEPLVKESHTVIVEREGNADSAIEQTLIPDPSNPGLYFGSLPAGSKGEYQVKALAHESAISSSAGFVVAVDPLEDRDTAAKPGIAEDMAKASGTSVVPPGELADLVDSIDSPQLSRVVSREMELWDVPILYILLLFFVGSEWILRRRENLL